MIKRCNITLPPPRKIIELFCLDGRRTIGFWTGEQFLASGLRVDVWGWRELTSLASSDVAKLVEQAIGRGPSTQRKTDANARHEITEKPRRFCVINLQLPNGDEVYGMWDGLEYIHRGRAVQPVSWTEFRPLDARTVPVNRSDAA
jgi:hypothetical protein